MSWFRDLLNEILSSHPGTSAIPKAEPPQVIEKQPYLIATLAVLDEAKKWLGVHEVGGNNMGPDVERFQKAVDGKAQGEPWCMCFAQFCAKEAAVNNNFKLLLYPSELCVKVFEEARPENKITLDEVINKGKKPDPGWAVIWQDAGSSNGHTGIVKSYDPKSQKITTIEGNTDAQDGMNRDGNGVFEKIHDIHGYGSKKLLGFVRTVGV